MIRKVTVAGALVYAAMMPGQVAARQAQEADSMPAVSTEVAAREGMTSCALIAGLEKRRSEILKSEGVSTRNADALLFLNDLISKQYRLIRDHKLAPCEAI